MIKQPYTTEQENFWAGAAVARTAVA